MFSHISRSLFWRCVLRTQEASNAMANANKEIKKLQENVRKAEKVGYCDGAALPCVRSAHV